MGKGRVEAFTDGVVAIIITIMVLELKVPHGEDFSALEPLLPIFLSYVLSFINVGIYWNNLHNMFHTVQRVDGRVLWANLNLLFWLSLMPVTTAFMGENHFAPVPVAVYGVDLALCAIAYTILVVMLHRLHGSDTAFARALGNDRKGKISLGLLHRRNSAGLRQPMDRRRSLRPGRHDLVRAGQAIRTADRKSKFVLSPHRLQLFRHRSGEVGIALLQPLGRLDHRKVMAESSPAPCAASRRTPPVFRVPKTASSLALR